MRFKNVPPPLFLGKRKIYEWPALPVILVKTNIGNNSRPAAYLWHPYKNIRIKESIF